MKARLLVLESDIVLVGMRQIEEQIGVAPRNQEDVIWSKYGVVNWSTIQLTTIVEVSALMNLSITQDKKI